MLFHDLTLQQQLASQLELVTLHATLPLHGTISLSLQYLAVKIVAADHVKHA